MRVTPFFRLLLGTTAVFMLAATYLSAADESQPTQSSLPVDFSRQILPILSNKCFVCHGPDARDPDQLRLDSQAGASSDRGGYRAIDLQTPAKSRLLARINSADDSMPPADAEKQLTPAERLLLQRWISQGGKYARHWAFVRPRKQPPTGGRMVKTSEMIDAFVQARLKKQGLDFAPPADRGTLARRAAIVLTGLPPEPKQLDVFLSDRRPDAYQRFVDQMLNSPRYGEHQAHYWLDAVRYGDTHGLHLDNRRGIYPYRDWVVRAFNQNMPIDDFLVNQLAGDLLPNPSLSQLVATGFVRMNPTTAEGGAIPAEFQAKNNFDRTETLGTVLLGMTLTCARCHTHKYDPIPQTEYYRLLAFFNSTAEHSMDGNSYTYAPIIKAPEDQAAWSNWSRLEAERETLLKAAQELVTASLKLAPEQLANWNKADRKEQLRQLANDKGPFAKTSVHPPAKQLLERAAKAEKTFTTSLVAKDLPKPRTTRVLYRGEYNRPKGEALKPGILTVMSAFPKDAPRNRLGLARWLTSPEHPLVTRVLINRVWQRTFGHALVRSPEDFGRQGQQPTHPLLLDWLAVELQDSGWDLKHMLRLMVTSRTFQQQSAWRKGIEDPDNRLLARGPRHRLDAEVLRDMALWSSGLLDPQMGGEGCKPYQPAGMWLALAHPGSNTKKYVRDKGVRLYRRSLYVYWKRTSPHPMMTLFDAPDRESSCVKRSRTNTSLQSLGLLNETQRIEMSRALAGRLMREASGDHDRLNLLFRMLACQHPTRLEREACLGLLKTMRQRYEASPKDAQALLTAGDAPRDESLPIAAHAAWTQVAITVLASDVALLLY